MLKRGLYEQVINKSLDRELERSDDIAASTGKLDTAEAPQILSHYISELVEKGLRETEAQQLLQEFFFSLREKRAGRPRWKPPVPENRGK